MNALSDRSCVICGARPVSSIVSARTCDESRCQMTYQQHLRRQLPTCRVCGRPLNALQSVRTSQTCDEISCRSQGTRQRDVGDDKRCRYCSVPLPPSQIEAGVCSDRDCRRVHVDTEAAEREREKRKAFEYRTQQAQVLRDELAAFHEHSNATEYFPVVVPWFRTPLTTLPSSRLEALREHLQSAVDEYRKNPTAHSASDSRNNPWPPLEDAAETLTGRVCGHCRGSCCQKGETHAFVSGTTIASLLERRPELELEDVVDAYLTELPATSYDNSCVFHAETGCALPHDMRAETCGHFFCWGQQELRASLEQGAPVKAFVALSTIEGDLVEGRFLDGDP